VTSAHIIARCAFASTRRFAIDNRINRRLLNEVSGASRNVYPQHGLAEMDSAEYGLILDLE
jgi:hypothetical protein